MRTSPACLLAALMIVGTVTGCDCDRAKSPPTSAPQPQATVEVAKKNQWRAIPLMPRTDGQQGTAKIKFVHLSGPPADVAIMNKKQFNAFEDGKRIKDVEGMKDAGFEPRVWLGARENLATEQGVPTTGQLYFVVENTGDEELKFTVDVFVEANKK